MTDKVKAKSKKTTSKKVIVNNSATTKSNKSESKRAAWTFPKNSLEDAINIAKAIEEKNAGNPMNAEDLAKAVGYQQASDWRFLDLLRSANQYGMVSGSGQKVKVHLEKLGQDIVAPSSTKQRQDALLGAFRKVQQFEEVANYYGNKHIPEDEFFYNTLTREFSIPKDRVERFAEVFLANIKYLRSFNATSTSTDTEGAGESQIAKDFEKSSTSKSLDESRIRKFLDTCFVMMPFGEWNNRYYQEIYIPAIKEAGFEPIRADELFSTGSVVEQIWDQIKKSKVLLADLTDKNPNVFYELGLAHAINKPVVFLSADIEDVPFDLRHLRVIIYDNREPNWASKLMSSITDYLRNAIKEPESSIPHPFRKQ